MKPGIIRLIVLFALPISLITGASAWSAEQNVSAPLMTWHPPRAGEKQGIIQDLDLMTLAELGSSGALQYFQPRPEKDRWDVVVGMMIHAPIETVWDTATDYLALCSLMPNTFDSCAQVSKEPDKTRMQFKLHTSILNFTFHLNITDEITVPQPYHWRMETVEGSLKGRVVELLLVPLDSNRTMGFMRYYGAMRSVNPLIRLILDLVPDLETPVYASATNYHLGSYKKEAEKRAGFKSPAAPAPINYAALNTDTLHKLCASFAGLVRETPAGKTVNAMAFASINAPPEIVWNVMTDFEHYNTIFPDSNTVVESRSENEVVLRQSIKQINAYIFNFEFNLHARYTLEKPAHLSYVAIDGLYKDTSGDFVLLPYQGDTKTFVFATIGAVLDRDTSLTVKIVRSGAFPFDSVVNLFFARSVLNQFKAEAEKRSG